MAWSLIPLHLLTLPNTVGYGAGTLMDLWSINPNTGTFDKVGVGQVSADGSVINTISGGVRNSSWHFFVPTVGTPIINNNGPISPSNPSGPPDPSGPPPSGPPDDGCPVCHPNVPLNSSANLNTGVVSEDKSLVSYQSLGVTRGLTLHYDSLRANPTPIINFSARFGDTGRAVSTLRLVATLGITEGNLTYQVPGANAKLLIGLPGNGYNLWSLPDGYYTEQSNKSITRCLTS